MKRLVLILAIVVASAAFSTASWAHEGNDHVRGVVTEISATAIKVRTTGTKVTTLTLDDKTVFEKSGAKTRMEDLKVGDRVVVDVPEHTTRATLVQFGAPAKAPAAKTAAK